MSKRKRDTIDSSSSSDDDGINCCSCDRSLSSNYYLFSACRHPICISCFSAIREQATTYLQCPAATCPSDRSTGYHCVESQYITRSKDKKRKVVGDLIHLQQQVYDPRKDPVRCFESQPKVYQDQNMNISFTFPLNGAGKTISLDIPLDSKVELSDHNKKCLETLFRKLHTPIMSNDKYEMNELNCPGNPNNEAPSSHYPSTGLLYKRSGDDDNTTLRRILNSLSTGTFLKDMKTTDANHLKRKRMSFTSAEIMRSSTQGNSTSLQQGLAELLKIFNVSSIAQKVLVDFGISASRKSINLKDMKQVHATIQKDFAYHEKKWCLFILIYDNVGFRIRGAQCGYDQYVALQLLIKTVEELKGIGLYAPPGQPKLCRESLNWKDIRDECDETVILPGDNEYDELGYHHLLMIESVLSVYKTLPTLQQMKDMVERAHLKKDISYDGTTIKAEFGTRPIRDGEVVVEATVPPEEDESDVQTMYDVNGSVHVNPLHMDLNCSRTVDNITKFGLEARAKSQEPADEDDSAASDRDDYGGEEPIMAQHFYSVADGVPSYMWYRSRDEKMEEYKHCKHFPGGFHVLLNTTKVRGSIFQHTHLIDLIKPYREGKGSQQWVLDPGDPTQTLREIFEIGGAVYARACLKTSNYLKKDEITAHEVHVHMRLCAQEDPNEFLIFMELKLCDIIAMMVDSEKTGENGCNPTLFRTALTLSGLFLAVTNSYKYVQIISELKVWWRCASDADKKIWEEFIFTAKTADGKRIFMDRFMEWMVRDLRDVLGKFQSRNMYTRFIEAVVSLNDRNKSKKIISEAIKSGDDTSEPTTDTVEVGYVFVLTYLELEKINLWGLEETRYYTNGKPRQYYDDKLYDLSGKVKLNPDIISLVNIGYKRLKNYADKYYLKGDLNIVVRPYTETNLARIPILMSDKDSLAKRQNIWATSLRADYLVDYYKDDLIANLVYLNSLLIVAGREAVPAVRKDLNKTFHAQAVARARELAKDLPGVQGGDFSTPGAWSEDVSSAEKIKDKIEDALTHKFFMISDKAKEKFGEFKTHRVSGTAPRTPERSPLRTPVREPSSMSEHSYPEGFGDFT